MLPYSKYKPACLFKGFIHKQISGLVGLKFIFPKFGITFGVNGMKRTAMPETTINKDG